MRALAASLVVLSAAIAVRFWFWGAWPVALFSFIAIPMLPLLLAINQRRARASELIMLDTMELQVIRTDSSGRRQQVSLPAAWLRVDLDSTKGIPRVVLSSHGRGCEVGGFLHEPERLSLFDAINDALYRTRHPIFDNPQLREE
jgi:uncharacterized membrane protein